jgi:predicted GIY-YIG superfamily endonuclease
VIASEPASPTSRARASAQSISVKRYWVYMLLCADGSYYVGVTNNVEARVAQHAEGMDITCYTFRRRPVRLVFAEWFSSPGEAIHAEKRLKGWSRAKKQALAQGDWELIHVLAKDRRGSASEAGDHPSRASG